MPVLMHFLCWFSWELFWRVALNPCNVYSKMVRKHLFTTGFEGLPPINCCNGYRVITGRSWCRIFFCPQLLVCNSIPFGRTWVSGQLPQPMRGRTGQVLFECHIQFTRSTVGGIINELDQWKMLMMPIFRTVTGGRNYPWTR